MVLFSKIFKFAHTRHLCNPQDCVSAATTPNPPNAIEQEKQRNAAAHHLALPPHYIDRDTTWQAVPLEHPNAGIGGYNTVPHRSFIGGYRNIDRESEIGNDHVGIGGYPTRDVHVLRTVYVEDGLQKERPPTDSRLH